MTPSFAKRTEWTPKTALDRQLVRHQVDLIAQSLPFRNSKRYPSFLRYAVERTLRSETDKLHERQLGVELFRRPVGYDANADPIVRVTAGEIRKRLAQFYEGDGRNDRLRMEFPPGGYVVHFYMQEDADGTGAAPAAMPPIPASLQAESGSSPFQFQERSGGVWSVLAGRQRHMVALWVVLVAVALAAVATGTAWYWHSGPGVWSNFLSGASGNVMVVVGQPPNGIPEVGSGTPQIDLRKTPRSIFPGDLASTMIICDFVARHGRKCILKQSRSVELSTLQNQTAIYIGGYNNDWVLRMTQPLPFRFGSAECACIVESKTGQLLGKVDFTLPVERIDKDYGIVARFHSEMTDRVVFIIAGIGQMSTEAVATYVTSPQGLADLNRRAPYGWKGSGMEAVLTTDVTYGHPGHTQVLRTAFW